MVFDTSRVGFLSRRSSWFIYGKYETLSTYLAIFQTQIRNTTHRRRLPLRKVLVDRIDLRRDMLESLIEQFTSGSRVSNSNSSRSLPIAPALLDIIELITGLLRVLPRLLRSLLGLFQFALNIFQPVHSLHVRRHSFDLSLQLRDGRVEARASLSSAILRPVSMLQASFRQDTLTSRSSSSKLEKSTSMP